MIPYQNPTIYLGNLRIDEPITALTDILFSVMCVYAFLKTKSLSSYKAANLYRWFFLLTGFSTLTAALTGHAFLYYFGAEAKIYGWLFGVVSLMFAPFAAIYHTKNHMKESLFKPLLIIVVIEVIIAFILTIMIHSFVVVEIHMAFGLLLIVSVLEYMNYKDSKSVLSKNMIIGVGICVIAVMCHVLKLAISKWFNHIDLSHVFMIISVYVMYKGVSLFQPSEQAKHLSSSLGS